MCLYLVHGEFTTFQEQYIHTALSSQLSGLSSRWSGAGQSFSWTEEGGINGPYSLLTHIYPLDVICSLSFALLAKMVKQAL